MKIFQFKTNINSVQQQEKIKPLLHEIKGITRWSINNNAMQVEGYGIKPEKIIDIVTSAGYTCTIIED